MEISNFSSLIEIGVTLNIACVAIEYVKSYTNVLCNQVFNLKAQIEDSCKECIDFLIDETTIRSLPNANVNGSDTDIIKDRLISKRGSLVEEIKEKETNLKEMIKQVCEVKNISSICLWLSLFGLTGLFLMGFEDTGEKANNSGIHFYWTILAIFSLLFSSLGWIRGNKEKKILKAIDYCSLRFSIFTFIFFTFLGCFLYYIAKDSMIVEMIESWWLKTLIFSMLLIYSNFIASAFEVWNRAKEGQNEIIEAKNALMTKCTELNNSIYSLQGVGNVAAMLTTDVTTG